MNKKKLLIANDASFLGTGYAVYGQELLSRLHNSGKYEIAELACYADAGHPAVKSSPWKFYPNAVGPQDSRFEQYKNGVINQFGAWRFNQVLLDFKPDIVFDIRDYWMYAYQETSPLRKYFKWVLMPTVDSAPQKEEWLYTFANADLIVPYTQWAKNTLQNQCGNKINLFPEIANAGVDINKFKPVNNRKELQQAVFGKDVSITGLVMRNQKRKLFPDILQAYNGYLNRLLDNGHSDLFKKSYLYMHTSFPEESGWDLATLLLEYGLLDKVYCTGMCRNCRSIYPTKFHESISTCKGCGKNSVVFPSAGNPIPNDLLVTIYNIFDLFVQYAICEGFGMPQVEAAACGVPLASVHYSAMQEIVDNLQGYRIPVQRLFRELETGADRAYPDINATIDILYDFHVNKTEEERDNMSKTTRVLCEEYYTWDKTFQVWDRAFDSIDISSKINWDAPNQLPTNHANTTVPPNLPPMEFVEYVIKNIINEPYLLNTAPIVNLIRNFTTGIVAGKGVIISYSHKDIINMLERYLNNKIVFEDLRSNPSKMDKEDYLNGT